jgi:hypothetical protein
MHEVELLTKRLSILCLMLGMGQLVALGQGRVQRANGESLSFVSIIIDGDPTRGMLTDIEGRFSQPPDPAWQSLTFSYVGYERLLVKREALGPAPWVITLEPTEHPLPEITVVAGENPAHRIIRQAAAKRSKHDPESYAQFLCTIYNQVIVDPIFNREAFEKSFTWIDSARQVRRYARRDSLEQKFTGQHLMVMESVVERRYRRPGQLQDILLKNHVSGLEQSQLPALANLMQPFSFHSDYIEVLMTSYLNPISRGSTTAYAFRLEDTLFAGADTVWVISFKPAPGSTIDGLEGLLHIHGADYALRNVRARPAGQKRIDMLIEQQYRSLPDGRWFPDQLRFEIQMPEYPDKATGISIRGLTWVQGVNTDRQLSNKDFDPAMPIFAERAAFVRSDTFMNRFRPGGALSIQEERTYVYTDSLFRADGLDKLITWVDGMSSGVLQVHARSPIHLDLNRFIDVNAVEGFRLNLGLTTREPKLLLRPSSPVDTRVWLGYGFSDRNWKYGADLRARLHRHTQTRFEVEARQELTDPGSLYEIEYPFSAWSRRFFTPRMDLTREVSAGIRSTPIFGLDMHVHIVVQDLQPLYAYTWQTGTDSDQQRFYLQEWRAGFRWRRGRTSQQSSVLEPATRLPVVEGYMTQSFSAFNWTTPPAYRRFVASMHQRIPIRKLGNLRWRIEAGLTEGDAPLARLFTVIRPEDNVFNWVYIPNFFQTADRYLLMDRFAQVTLSQELGYILWHIGRRSRPLVQLTHQSILGDLRQPERHGDIAFRSPDRGFHESGIVLHHLLRFNYVNIADFTLGAGAFIPYGPGLDRSWQRVGIRFTTNLQF